MRPRPWAPRRRSASTRRRSTRRSMPPAMAGSISQGLSSTCAVSLENSDDHLSGSARVSAQASHRLRYGRGRIPLARSGAVQLGAGLVRRRSRARRCEPRSPGAVDRRCRRQPGDQIVVRGALPPFQPGGKLPARAGIKRGDHLLLLLGNVVPLWETMLAAIKLGVVVIPATTLLTPDELRDRLDRGRARVVVASQDQVAKFSHLGGGKLIRIVVGASSKHEGWLP